jgi:hypothetical protein
MSLLDRIIEQRKSLLIDRVVFGDMLNVAGQAECIDIGNVEAYWSNRPKEVFRLGEFPFVAPPFPYLFFFVDTPNSVRPLEEQGMTKKQKKGKQQFAATTSCSACGQAPGSMAAMDCGVCGAFFDAEVAAILRTRTELVVLTMGDNDYNGRLFLVALMIDNLLKWDNEFPLTSGAVTEMVVVIDACMSGDVDVSAPYIRERLHVFFDEEATVFLDTQPTDTLAVWVRGAPGQSIQFL